MISKSSDKTLPRFSHFMGRVFGAVLLFFVQSFHSQIFISGGASIHLEKEMQVLKTDSLVSYSKSKIYLTPGVQLSDLDSEKNYEIVETASSEKKKIEFTKQLASKITQPQFETKIQHEIASVKVNPVSAEILFSTQKSEVYFSFSGGLSKITVPVSQFNGKQVFSSENYKTSLSFGESKLVVICFKTIELLTAQNKSAFSVRPPPFLA